MTIGWRWPLALALTAGCGADPSASTTPRVAPVVAVSGEPATMASAPSEPRPAKEIPYEPCVARLFDHPAGNHGLSAFQAADDRYGYRDATQKVVIAPRFLHAYEFSPEGVAAVIGQGGPAFIDTSGKQIAPAFNYDNGPDYFTEARARIVEGGKVGFIDAAGNRVVPPSYDYASAFCRDRAVVCNGCKRGPGEHADLTGGQWGVIDRSGGVVAPLRFDSIAPFEDGQAEAVLNGKRVVIDQNGLLRP